MIQPMPRGQPPISYTSVDGRRERDPAEADQVYALFRAVDDGRSAREAADMRDGSVNRCVACCTAASTPTGSYPSSQQIFGSERRQLAKGRPQHRQHKGPRR